MCLCVVCLFMLECVPLTLYVLVCACVRVFFCVFLYVCEFVCACVCVWCVCLSACN